MPAVKAAKTPAPDFAVFADELGALEKKMSEHQAKFAALHGADLARIELLRKTLRAACTAKPEADWTIEGKHFTAIVGPCFLQRVINFPKLVKTIGAVMFASFGRCTLKDLEEHVAPQIVAAVVTSDRTGSRPVCTFERGA
jgi:hypothetical protein